MDYNLCSTGKVAYDSTFEVEEALIYSRINFESGATNYYQCNSCECYHLTSSREKHPLLDDEGVKNRILKERKANIWKGRY
jgi:hypothetical protein